MWYNEANWHCVWEIIVQNYTLAGLTAKLQNRLKDEDYPTDTLAEFINDAYFEILGYDRYKFLEQCQEVTVLTSGELIVPDNYQNTIRLTATNDYGTRPLTFIAPRAYLSDPQSSLNNYGYTVYGNKLFYKLPKVESSSTTTSCSSNNQYNIHHHYLAKPTPLVNTTDIPIIPYEFGEAIIYGALSRAERLRDNFDYAQIYENKCNDLCTAMALRYGPRQLDDGSRATLPVHVILGDGLHGYFD